ncbi:hypothetical protein L2E82_15723 [Cichorium intybus]|uniref:Uncharacterized protein n=1 Tax=Cichorium intybus TaxID=13427 RepID=A0ACB9F402_CICIN|nr:hypothetical protein L2E82_15723 [Cichorium intybus]
MRLGNTVLAPTEPLSSVTAKHTPRMRNALAGYAFVSSFGTLIPHYKGKEAETQPYRSRWWPFHSLISPSYFPGT